MAIRIRNAFGFLITAALLVLIAVPVIGAYKSHDADRDVNAFLAAYPETAGSKLDNCYLCHKGGTITKKGKTISIDNCDFCHIETNWGQKILSKESAWADTLNSFGLAYLDAGRNQAAFTAIADLDSDGDGFTNLEEIQALRLPGEAGDNPNVAEAPAVVYTREKMHQLTKTSQFMAVDTSKAGDYYATYSGADMWTLLQDAGISANEGNYNNTYVTIFAADGYNKTFPVTEFIEIDENNNFKARKTYAQGHYYNRFPWISCLNPGSCKDGDKISGQLQYLMAYEEDGYPLLQTKIVNDGGRSALVGEGPYRFVSPLTQPVVPDRSAYTIDRGDSPYPYNHDRPVIRNGDNCIKAVVAICVHTGNENAYHYDLSGKSWTMIKNGELVIYGSINPQNK